MAGRGKKRTVGKLFLQFSMGSGGNVGRAIYARDLSRDKSRGEYICAHMSPPLKEHARRRRRHHTEEEQDLCVSWHRLTTPFSRSSFLLLLLLAPAADRAVFRASNLSAPLISSNASSIFPSPVRNSYTSAREHACNLPRFQKRVRIPARVVSAPGWARTRKGNSFVIPVEYSYESCVNNTKRRERRDGRD